MNHLSILICCYVFLFLNSNLSAQENNGGWFSLGGRSTLNSFSHDGIGIGTGGQFRIQLTNSVNTSWFYDYIVINRNNIRSEYQHIGWSVMYYPFKHLILEKFQPFILAGHCFDYNKKTVISNPEISKDRWGSAVQGGLGVHYHISPRLDITLKSQYMIHLTSHLEIHQVGIEPHVHEHDGVSFEGHLLTTISMNYKIFKLWNK